jgi:mannosyltransferase OCH1-like enzyme
MENNIPKRFIRVWIGGTNPIPNQFNKWWKELKELHPDYEFITLLDWSLLDVPLEFKKIIPQITTCAGIADIARILAVYQLGGIYVDTDIMPIKSFDTLVNSNQPFLGKRSSKSFETAVIGSPKNHIAMLEVIKAFPKWYNEHKKASASVQTGPAFVSSVLFGRKDITHLPIKTFYPYNGFMAPKRFEKEILFKNKNNFPEEMIAAHFSNHKWGGKP